MDKESSIPGFNRILNKVTKPNPISNCTIVRRIIVNTVLIALPPFFGKHQLCPAAFSYLSHCQQ